MKRAKFLLRGFLTEELKGLDGELKTLKHARNQFLFLNELHKKIRIEKLHRSQARDVAKWRADIRKDKDQVAKR